MNRKRLKELEQQLKANNLELLDWRTKRGGHCRLQLRNRHGKTMLYFASVTPSDPRSDKNMIGDFRRFSRER